MTDTHAEPVSEAARSLARARWGAKVLDHAVEIVINRGGQLRDAQREQLRQVADNPAGDGRNT